MIAARPMHQVEGVPLEGGGRYVVTERGGYPVGPEGHGEQETLVATVEEPAEGHREAAFGVASPTLAGHRAQGALELGAHPGRVEELDPVAVVRHPVHRLTQALGPSAGKREPVDVDDRLVADVEVPHPGRPVGGQPGLACAEHRDTPAVGVCVRAKPGPRGRALVGRSDGIG